MKLLDGHELQRLHNTEQRTPEKFHFIPSRFCYCLLRTALPRPQAQKHHLEDRRKFRNGPKQRARHTVYVSRHKQTPRSINWALTPAAVMQHETSTQL